MDSYFVVECPVLQSQMRSQDAYIKDTNVAKTMAAAQLTNELSPHPVT